MITDLQHWCVEAKENGTSRRLWNELKQMYISSSNSEDSLRTSLQTFALNHDLTITFEEAPSSMGREETYAILSSL